ncbi:hypothetical protein AAFX30_06435 [Vibrio chagasii]|uniref:hypothetical protein n=1 Tax=Vibrio chagasii TaxID=170679 RepID=UPI0038CD2804
MNDQVFEALNYKAVQECPHSLNLVLENEAKESIAINVRPRELIKHCLHLYDIDHDEGSVWPCAVWRTKKLIVLT